MTRIKRRQFLQFARSTLATIGLSKLYIIQQSHRYAKVLAQSTPRKLALLVGINDYPNTNGFAALKGCVTDVELQRHLLIHRFGFNSKDIRTLTDKQATRQGILDAFEEHLIRKAKPGDVIVFHYSGHGSRVTDPDSDNADKLNSTFVPVDAQLPTGFPDKGGVVQDIMGHTLFLLMSAVQSENFTVVLDSCKQVLQGINRIEAVPVPYPGEVHYLLSRITAADRKALLALDPPQLLTKAPALKRGDKEWQQEVTVLSPLSKHREKEGKYSIPVPPFFKLCISRIFLNI